MANNNIEQQIFDSLGKAKHILIVLSQNAHGDALGAGLAFYSFLKKLEKEPELLCNSGNLGTFAFLPGVENIKSDLPLSQSFVISVATKNAELDELSYEVKDNRVDIFLKPKSGKFESSDVSFRSGKFPYDLIVTLDTPSLEHLGPVYEKNTDLFFETPVINIDHHPANEHYGQINLVDLTATSTSEILTAMIEEFEAGLIDEHIATNLLTGIIVETNSFQHIRTTPKAFLHASSLIAKGGRHQEIVRELYKTKSISLLKLWGRALARLKEVSDLGLTYSLISYSDLEKAGSSAEGVLDVMREMILSLAGRKIIMFLAEIKPSEIVGYFYLHSSIKPQIVTAALSGQMLNGYLGTFKLSKKNLLEAESEVLERLGRIKQQLVV